MGPVCVVMEVTMIDISVECSTAVCMRKHDSIGLHSVEQGGDTQLSVGDTIYANQTVLCSNMQACEMRCKPNLLWIRRHQRLLLPSTF